VLYFRTSTAGLPVAVFLIAYCGMPASLEVRHHTRMRSLTRRFDPCAEDSVLVPSRFMTRSVRFIIIPWPSF
jgi:hypothetical protein